MKYVLACILTFISCAVLAQTPLQVPTDSAQMRLSFAPVVKQVAPAVVNIYAKRIVTQRLAHPFMADPMMSKLFGGGLARQRVESSLGSGVLVRADGLVVTNTHVIKGAEEIVVVLADGREFPATISVLDTPTDVALLRIDSKGESLPFARLQPSDGVEVGDLVLAIGNPFGVGQTVTSGIVSALARSSLSINDFNFFIQTDAAVNPGNSGGPLVSMDGGIIGINTAIYSRDGGSLGIGFAVPTEIVETVIKAEISGQKKDGIVLRPWLGVETQPVTADIARALNMNVPQGVLIKKIHPLSPLLGAGAQVGDVISKINERTIKDEGELRFRLAAPGIGAKIKMGIISKSVVKTLDITLIAPPESPPRNQTLLEDETPLKGVTIANINPVLSAELGLPVDAQGVVVISVKSNVGASRFISPGVIIRALNGSKIVDVGSVVKLSKTSTAKGWVAVLEKGGQTQQVVVR